MERDATQNVLWRLEHGNVDHIRPRLAVLLIGTNNTGHNTPQDIAQGVTEIVRRLRVRLPATHLLVLGMFPQGADPNHPRRRAANRLISRLHDGRRVFYLDIGQRFVRGGGTIGSDIMPDLLHLSLAGYRIWAEAMEPTVQRLLGDVLEVETESPAETASHLRPRFGEPLVEGERLLFRVAGGAVSLDHLTHELRAHARAIRLRRPDLNDVYLWIHRDPPDGHPENAAGTS